MTTTYLSPSTPVPSPAQLEAATDPHPRIVCIAGPGSGKTRTLVARLERVLGNPEARAAVVTYTNDSADEIRSRLQDRQCRMPDYLGTLHGLVLPMLQRYGGAVGWPQDGDEVRKITVLDEQQGEQYPHELACGLGWTKGIAPLTEALALPYRKPTLTLSPEERIAASVHRKLQAESLVTFDTLLWWGARVAHLETRYTDLFVDEYQDSGPMDHAIYRSMVVQNRFVVGDPDQGIFGFRGGDSRLLVALAQSSDWKTILLERNYRSTPEVCRAADQLIRQNSNRIQKQTRSVSEHKGSVTTSQHPNPGAEHVAVTNRIAESVFSLDEIAILCRTNDTRKMWLEVLTQQGFAVARQESVERPPDWKLATTLLGYLANPQNNTLARLFYSAQLGVTTAGDMMIRAESGGVTLDSLGMNLAVKKPAWLEVCGRILSHSSNRAIEGVRPNRKLSLPETILALAEDARQQRNRKVSQGITVSTIHAAKGREWDLVFLPSFDDQMTPGKKVGPELEEERRLAFVGLTRARRAVHVSFSVERRAYGKRVVCTPSRFIGEMLQ